MSVPGQKEGDSSTPKRDADGHPIHNEILLRLPRKEFERLLSHLEFVRLTLRLVLHEAGETLKSGYFCNSGIFSVVSVMPDGKSVEVGLVGKEGFSAVPLVAGFRTANTRTVVQGEGTAFRVDAGVLRSVLRECPVLERELQRYAQLLALQAVQIAACNRLHEVDERLARWLLMTEDRLSSSSLPLTQDFIAQMLGYPPVQCHRFRGHAAEGRIDLLHSGQRNHSQPPTLRTGSLRLLWPAATTE